MHYSLIVKKQVYLRFGMNWLLHEPLKMHIFFYIKIVHLYWLTCLLVVLLFIRLCLDMTHRLQVAYSTCYCLSDHSFKYWTGCLTSIFLQELVLLVWLDYHHQVVLTAWSSLSLFHHPSLSSIASSRSSRLHSVSTQSWCKFLLVSQHWPGHVLESIRESCSWVCSCFYCSDLYVLFVLHGWFVRQEVGDCTAAFCKVLLPRFVQNSRQCSCVPI